MELILLYLKYPLRMLGAILCGASSDTSGKIK